MNEPLPRTETSNPDAGIRPGEPPLTPPSTEALAYQPISGWAIAGFGTAALFAALVGVSTVVGLMQGAPFFFPVWVLSLAVVGIVFSLIGQKQIQDSEGTRAGAKLARLGIWLSLLSGLGYLSYFYVTGLALQSQANTFLTEKSDDGGFFPRLIEGATRPAQIDAAYLLTQPVVARTGRPEDEVDMVKLHDNPGKDGTAGPLTQFRDGFLTRLFYKHLAKDAEITPLGVQDWKYEANVYKVYRLYRIKTKEIELEVQMAVWSTESEAGRDRKWFVNMRESFPIWKTIVRTPLGEGIKVLRFSADHGLRLVVQKLNDGAPLPQFAEKIDQTKWHLVQVRDGNRDAVKTFLRQTFASSDMNRFKNFNVLTGQEEVGKWDAIDGKIRITLSFRFSLDKGPGGPAFGNVNGYAVLETKQPIDPAKLDMQAPPPDWNIVAIEFTQVLPPAPPGRGK